MIVSGIPAAAEAATPVDALAPLRFPCGMRITPDQFALLCAENRDAVLELTADGRVLSMTPTGSETGARNSRLEMRLLLWADQQAVEVWPASGEPQRFEGTAVLEAGPDFPALQLQLAEIWAS